jgi:hypothetical protein
MRHHQRAEAQLNSGDLQQEELWPNEIAALEAWIERRWRRRIVRTIGYLVLAGVVGAATAIAYTREGSDAIATWLTMGHTYEARAQVSKLLGRK